jgi:hypothetical protein
LVVSRRWWSRQGSSRQLRKIRHDDVGSVLAQRSGMFGVEPVDAYDVPEPTGASGLDAGERVLEHGADIVVSDLAELTGPTR